MLAEIDAEALWLALAEALWLALAEIDAEFWLLDAEAEADWLADTDVEAL